MFNVKQKAYLFNALVLRHIKCQHVNCDSTDVNNIKLGKNMSTIHNTYSDVTKLSTPEY